VRIIVVEDYGRLCRAAARHVCRVMLCRPGVVIALPTGRTPVGVYRELVTAHRDGRADFHDVVVFNLDEYYGIPPDHAQSFARFTEAHLLQHVAVREHNIPNSLATDHEAECDRYEGRIAERGGIDLAVLGMGQNGHIGFNEPDTPFGSATHLARLSLETRQREAELFGSLESVPQYAITMGIRTIMNARGILLLVNGVEKAEIVRKSLFGAVSRSVPASILQLHPDVTVLAEQHAAERLHGENWRGTSVEIWTGD